MSRLAGGFNPLRRRLGRAKARGWAHLDVLPALKGGVSMVLPPMHRGRGPISENAQTVARRVRREVVDRRY